MKLSRVEAEAAQLAAPAKAGGRAYLKVLSAGLGMFTSVLSRVIGGEVLTDVVVRTTPIPQAVRTNAFVLRDWESALGLARKHAIEMPITEAVVAVLYEGLPVDDLGPLLFSNERPLLSLDCPDGGVAVEAHHQEIAQGASIGEVLDMARVDQVKAAVGETEGLRPGDGGEKSLGALEESGR